VFTRLGDDIYAARERGWRWRLEQLGLERSARAAGVTVPELFRRELAALPEPDAAQLEAADPTHVLDVLPAPEAERGKRSLWRLRAWEIRRSVLARDGLEGVQRERVQAMVTRLDWQLPMTVEAILDGAELDRHDMRLLAGFAAELGREQYHKLLLQYLDQFTDQLLIDREARRLGVSSAQLEADEAGRQGPITDAEVDGFIAANPHYRKDRAAARDNVRRLREAGARAHLVQRLRAAAVITVDIDPPVIPSYPIDPPAARGERGAPELVAFHALGCPDCNAGTALLIELERRYAGRVRVRAADHFRRGSLVSYRAALALHCAAEQGDHRPLLRALLEVERPVEVGDLAQRAAGVGLDRARFEACLLADRYLPEIFENLSYSARLGLERDVPAFFIDGRRLTDLADLSKVVQQIDENI
jgi:hypothetical protein